MRKKKVGSSEGNLPWLDRNAHHPPDKYTGTSGIIPQKRELRLPVTVGGDRMDHYGAGYIKFVIMSDDGSFIDPEDTQLLKNYVITGQSVSLNTEAEVCLQHRQ